MLLPFYSPRYVSRTSSGYRRRFATSLDPTPPAHAESRRSERTLTKILISTPNYDFMMTSTYAPFETENVTYGIIHRFAVIPCSP